MKIILEVCEILKVLEVKSAYPADDIVMPVKRSDLIYTLSACRKEIN